jgi:predicted acylesterase/phospholipase RssA
MKHLAIGPGAMAYFGFLGALAALRDSDQLHNLEEISGASAGGLLAFFYIVANGNIQAILDYSIEIPIKDVMKFNIRLFLKHYGFVNHSKIKSIISNIIRVYFSQEDVTFEQLRNLRPDMPDLYISAYCVNLSKTEYFSHKTSPTMSVIDALCMTVSVPFLFASVLWNENRYIDGGTLEDSPSAVFLGNSDVAALRYEWSPTYNISSLTEFLTCIMYASTRLRHKYNVKTYTLKLEEFKIFDFSISNDLKLQMFSSGYNSIKIQEKVPGMTCERLSYYI